MSTRTNTTEVRDPRDRHLIAKSARRLIRASCRVSSMNQAAAIQRETRAILNVLGIEEGEGSYYYHAGFYELKE